MVIAVNGIDSDRSFFFFSISLPAKSLITPDRLELLMVTRDEIGFYF